MAENKAARPNGAADKIQQIDGVKLAYAVWLASSEKNPKTKSAWAEEHKVSRDTLWEWERSDWMAQFVAKLAPGREATWTAAFANLERIALQDKDNYAAISAIKELGKLLGKYPSEKVSVSVEHVAYVQPGALREMSLKQYPELRAN